MAAQYTRGPHTPVAATWRASWAPSRLRKFLRNRRVQTIALLAFGLGTSLLLAARVAAIEQERAQWGESVTVLVVTAPVAMGDAVADAVTTTQVPAAVVPANAATQIDSTAVAQTSLYTGELLLLDRITDANAPLPVGHAAVTVSVTAHVPFLSNGDIVDLWSIDAANLTSQRVATRVVVMAYSDRDITVLVPDEHVSDLTAASLRPLTVTVVG